MEKVVIAAASNIDHIEKGMKVSKQFLNGASIYSGFASSLYSPTRVITCVGDEPENDGILNWVKSYRNDNVPIFDFIKVEKGKSFKQTFKEIDGKFVVTNKDYGNYNDWSPKIPDFEAETLLLGTGNPVFQKSVLDACIHAKHILLDSKGIHFKMRAEKIDALLKRVDTFFGTIEEIQQLLENCSLPSTITSSLFNRYPNLQVIIEKNDKKGGRVFTQDGSLYQYQPVRQVEEVCEDGAGDVFAGTYAALITQGFPLKEVIQKSAEAAAESVKHFGIYKVKKLLTISPEIKIRIEESRWKSRDGRDEKGANRSD